MRSKFTFGIAVVAAALLLSMTPAFGRGGGGGHGGGGGGGGGGGHGGGGGGGGHVGGGGGGGGGSFRSSGGNFSGGSSLRSSGNFSAGNSIRSGSNFSAMSGNHATFMKNNFPNHVTSGVTSGATGLHQTNRFANSNFSSLNKSNSFVRSQNINNTNLNHWSHNNGNLNNNFNHLNNNNFNHHGSSSFFFFPGFGWGWGGGWGLWGAGYGFGWGWPYYGYGWGGGWGYPLYGYNYYGYGGNGLYGNAYATVAPANTTVAMQPTDNVGAGQFADQGEIDFKAGKYQAAARDWQHALVDDSKNGAIVMLLAQALFAMGQYEEAAGATQAAMQMLPEDKWGVVITNYSQLYGNIQDYTDQLKALEKARDAKPDSPALRFLLGFHFGYLNYPKQAVREMDKGLTLAPKDLGAYKVREIFAAKWTEAPALPADVLAAVKQAMADAAKAGQEGGQKGPAGPKPSDGEKGSDPAGTKTDGPTGTPS